MLICWAAMAAATMTKGLVGLAIPGAILVIYTLWQRDRAAWRHLQLPLGLLLYAILVVPWFAAIEHAQPGALKFMLVHEHFQRYLTTVHERYQPWWFFVPILLGGVLPWWPAIVRALTGSWRATRPHGTFDPVRLLFVAIVFIFLFFSASDSKLAPYILPVLPLLALLAARDTPSAGRDLKYTAWLSLGLSASIAGALSIYPSLTLNARNLLIYRSLVPALVMAAALWALAGTIVLVRPQHRLRDLSVLATGHFAAALLLATVGAGALSWKYSGAPLANTLKSALAASPANTPVYAIRTFDWTLPFYVGQRLIPEAYRGELDYGLNRAPEIAIDDFDEFATRWQAAPAAFALIEPAELSGLVTARLPFRELGRTPELILVARH
jgi:4-amino-4-deoxy-L-arabinose transferase-like glycosyltransferase